MKILYTLMLMCGSHLAFAQALPFTDSCNTILWAVINTKGDTSYLLGTFHEFGNAFYDSYGVGRIASRADCIVLENVPQKSKNKSKITTDWTRQLPASDRELINDYMKKMNVGFTLKQARHIPPSWIAYALTQQLYKRECHTWTEQDVAGMDQYIMNGAITRKQRLAGLESSEDTFNVINTMQGLANNEDSQGVSVLKDLIVNEAKHLDTIRTQCWEADNYRNLCVNYKFSKLSTVDDPLFKDLLDRRNDAWMPQVKNLIDSNKAFIAVGMKHLFYQNGLIMQLHKSGYRIIPMTLHLQPVHYYRRK